MSSVRVRFAPSPTGFLHIGSARTALFNWLFARHHNGTFILRVDDTDGARSTAESMQNIFDTMHWLGLEWDEGPDVGGPHEPYIQSQRVKRHQECAQRLLDEGKAYCCYCTKDELAEKREQAQAKKRTYRYDGRCGDLSDAERAKFEVEGREWTVRLKIEPQTIPVEDLILGDVSFESDTLDDFIFMKPGFLPLYNYASTVDDADLEITHIIRGQDHLSNTPKQILIYKALEMEPPKFAHIPLVIDATGKKLSKRDGEDVVSVEAYRRKGYLPDALANYLVRLAWSADDEQEIFTPDELIEKFTLERVGKSPSRFDLQKLGWMNGQYVQKQSVAERTDGSVIFLEKAGFDLSDVPRAKLERIVDVVGDRLHNYADIIAYAAYFFTDDDGYEFDPAAIKKWFKKDDALQAIQDVVAVLEAVEPFDVAHIDEALRAWVDETGAKAIQVMQPIRVAVSGKMVGPGLFDVLELLGKDAVIVRLKRAANEIPSLR